MTKIIEIEKNKKRRWLCLTLISTLFFLVLFSSFTYIIDPFFHYHYPNNGLEYPINNQRYQNDGIVRNWDYDVIITGTSMSENFKTTDAERAFGGNAIKVPYAGAYFKEIDQNLRRAIKSNKNIRIVIRSIDDSRLIYNKDGMKEGVDYPTFLTNDLIFDDVKYLLNKDIFIDDTLGVLIYTKNGEHTTNFDDYSNWSNSFEYGIEEVLETYNWEKCSNSEEATSISYEERNLIVSNIQQNVTDLADENPNILFFCFFPPYSICYWDEMNNKGEIDKQLDAEKIAVEEMLKYPNIYVFAWDDDLDLIANLDNYRDQAHYGEWVNTWIIEWMAKGKGQLSNDNYDDYFKRVSKILRDYDYSSIK